MRPGALAALAGLAALAASGTAAQVPRYEGVRLATVEAGAPPPSERPSLRLRLRSTVAQTVPLAKGDSVPAWERSDRPGRGGCSADCVRVLVPPDTAAAADPWLARDKALHAGGSFLLTLGGQYLLVNKHGLSEAQALPVSAATALALGLVKEVADGRRARDPLFSWRDLAADATGVALAALVVGL